MEKHINSQLFDCVFLQDIQEIKAIHIIFINIFFRSLLFLKFLDYSLTIKKSTIYLPSHAKNS